MSRGFERSTRQAALRTQAGIGRDVARLREDAGVTRAALARGAGVDPSFLRRLEGGAEASFETYARLASALGADLAVRLYPNTGPAIRDRHQAQIAEALLKVVHPRWRSFPEVTVRRPARGWIDVGFHDPQRGVFVATEIQSDLRRLEQQVRWFEAKADSLRSWEGWTQLGLEPEISRCLVVRRTRATSAVAREFRRVLAAAYPADPEDALAALQGLAPWPGPALLWARYPTDRQGPIRFTPQP